MREPEDSPTFAHCLQGDLLVERMMAKARLDAPEQALQLLQDAERRGDLSR